MNILNWRRQLGVVCVLPLLLLTTGAAGPRLAVFPLPETIFPDFGNRLREDFVAKPGDVILTGRIMKTQTTILKDPISIAVDRFKSDLPAGTELTPVLAPPETTDRLGVKGRIYCGENQRAISAFVNELIGDLASKFESVVRFCFFDSDGDGKLDRGFLAGAKQPAMQVPVPIDPVAVRSTYFTQLHEDDIVRVRYRKFKRGSMKVQLEVEVLRQGAKTWFNYLLFEPVQGEELDKQFPIIETNPKKVAYPVAFRNVLGASIGVKNVTATGEATFHINKGFKRTMFRPVQIQVRYTFVYI